MTGPTAWAAFRLVFSSSSWTITAASDGTDEVDLDYGPDFQGWLDDVGSRRYAAAARGFVASQVLEVCGTLTQARISQLRLVGDRDAGAISERLKSYVKEQVRERLTRRFELRSWEARVRACIEQLPEPTRTDVSRYLGLDLLLPPKDCGKALNYLFKTIKPEICIIDGEPRFASTWRTESVLREERTGGPKALGRALGFRAGEALLQLMPSECRTPGEASVNALETKFRELVGKHDAWAFIALILDEDRARFDLGVPQVDDPELQNLIDQQPALLAEGLRDLWTQQNAKQDKELALLLSGAPCGVPQ